MYQKILPNVNFKVVIKDILMPSCGRLKFTKHTEIHTWESQMLDKLALILMCDVAPSLKSYHIIQRV